MQSVNCILDISQIAASLIEETIMGLHVRVIGYFEIQA